MILFQQARNIPIVGPLHFPPRHLELLSPIRQTRSWSFPSSNLIPKAILPDNNHKLLPGPTLITLKNCNSGLLACLIPSLLPTLYKTYHLTNHLFTHFFIHVLICLAPLECKQREARNSWLLYLQHLQRHTGPLQVFDKHLSNEWTHPWTSQCPSGL